MDVTVKGIKPIKNCINQPEYKSRPMNALETDVRVDRRLSAGAAGDIQDPASIMLDRTINKVEQSQNVTTATTTETGVTVDSEYWNDLNQQWRRLPGQVTPFFFTK